MVISITKGMLYGKCFHVISSWNQCLTTLISHFWVSQGMWVFSLHWLHNERDGVPNHQPHDYLLSRVFRHRSKKTSKLRVTGLCEGNSLVTSVFPAQRASNVENVSIWWRHHVRGTFPCNRTNSILTTKYYYTRSIITCVSRSMGQMFTYMALQM